jgi:hypothetical protein
MISGCRAALTVRCDEEDLHCVRVAEPLESGGGVVEACYLRSQLGDVERSGGEQGDDLGELVGVGEAQRTSGEDDEQARPCSVSILRTSKPRE